MTPVFEGPPMILRLVVFGKPTGFGCEFKRERFGWLVLSDEQMSCLDGHFPTK